MTEFNQDGIISYHIIDLWCEVIKVLLRRPFAIISLKLWWLELQSMASYPILEDMVKPSSPAATFLYV